MTPIEIAERNQRRALAPGASVWVSASAGTGKTKVLTDRLLALMLDGTEPSRLLCLTFTRAAAAEMANRLNAELAEWATLPPGALAQRLVKLTGREPDAALLAHAGRLFARVLDTPGGVKIATIHAFCQSLLRRFPLEAGVPPEFAVLDERSTGDLLAEAREHVIAAARAGADPGLAEALALVARHAADEERVAALVAGLAAERGKLLDAAGGEAALRARLCAALGLGADVAAAAIDEEFCRGGDEAALREALACGTRLEHGDALAAWLADPAGRSARIAEYLLVFLTKNGEIRKRLPPVLAGEAERALRYRHASQAAALRDATLALIRLGTALIAEYERRKALHGRLDYDDLVGKALGLLRRPGIAPWVLFKLDGGLDHILIDEAQDTNPEQWQIVAALADEFFAGEGARERARTVFAVGDAKQSIYSFQRADPREFLRMREHFQRRVDGARLEWCVVPLETSFRAAEPLLRAVDAVFADAAAADGVGLDGAPIRHLAARSGHAGLVELWPPAPPPPDDGNPRPLEARTRLARAIAATIARWLAQGEPLEPRGRAIRAGDVMVLVRRRDEFVTDLLRALKHRNVPVAGADRLVLTEQLAVQDLIALGQFLLFPEDDLTLATVLKGPLFGISEDELFRLAHGRGEERLWRRLRRLAPGHPGLAAAAERLGALLARADFVPPYELYAEILGAEGGRRAMLERLGPEADDPIEEFLAQALLYEREHVPSLQGFLHWLESGEIEVSRDFAARQRDEVRILTVHGAKGLEAPIVFLPDTMQVPEPRANLLWSEREAMPLWAPRIAMAPPAYRAEREAQRRRDLQEYRRLLYVALTRAQDRLYVCGWLPRITPNAGNWYTLCQAGWRGMMTPFAFDTTGLIGEAAGWRGEGLRLASAQAAPPADPARSRVAASADAALPGWLDRPPPPEPDPPKPLLPSRPGGSEPATLSPLATAGRDRFKRGLLVHRLLQALPELPPDERAAAARRFLALPAHGLDPAEQEEICRETLAVLAEPGFAELWGPQARAEVPVVGLIGGHALSGVIDRLVVTERRVLIVDYKTVRPPPACEDEVAPVYLRQLAIYRAALARIYPDRDIACALLWTEAPRLMPISPALIARHAP